jgi:diacylglycerol kinase family enzyme
VRIRLLYNQGAGDAISFDHIRETLERHGHELVRVVSNMSDSDGMLDDASDLVVAAGGDGTVAEAARLVAGRGIPLAILPMGTANNIALSLGIEGSVGRLVAGWNTARCKPFDLGVACGSWGERRFIEGVGGGLVPAGIAMMDGQEPVEEVPPASMVVRALRRYRDALSRLRPRRWTMTLDGTSVAGDFLLVEVLNIRSIGPNLVLAADADPSDSFLSVVTAGEQDREALARYLEGRLAGQEGPMTLVTHRAKRIDLQGSADIHVDDEVLGLSPEGHVSIRVEPAALELLA